MFRGAAGVGNKLKPKVKADNSVFDFFDGNAIAHNVADSKLFKTMIQDVQAAAPYKPPDRDTLGGNILDRQYNDDITEDKRLLGLPGVSKFGLAITINSTNLSLPRQRVTRSGT